MPVISISAVISLRRMVLSRIKNTSVRDGIFVRSVGVRGYSLFPRSLNYRLVVLLLRITVATCDRTDTIVDIRKDAGCDLKYA